MTQELLVPLEEYLSAGTHIGTKYKNGYSDSYVLKSRADGLKVIDTEQTNLKLQALINVISRYEPHEVAIMGRRENAKKPLQILKKLIGFDVYTGRYLPGMMSNAELDTYKEYKLVVVCDPLTDKNILEEAFNQGVFTAGFCDTNNKFSKLDLAVPINNKGKKSLGLALMILAKHYLINRKIIKQSEFNYTLDDFSDE
ncbi:MAG: 30S ribosomal protein S2 [Candidatus Nanoarchaeia archaeon]